MYLLKEQIILEMDIIKSNDKAVSTKLYHYYLKYP